MVEKGENSRSIRERDRVNPCFNKSDHVTGSFQSLSLTFMVIFTLTAYRDFRKLRLESGKLAPLNNRLGSIDWIANERIACQIAVLVPATKTEVSTVEVKNIAQECEGVPHVNDTFCPHQKRSADRQNRHL